MSIIRSTKLREIFEVFYQPTKCNMYTDSIEQLDSTDITANNSLALHTLAGGETDSATPLIKYLRVGSSDMHSANAIDIPRKVHRPKVTSNYEDVKSYLDVDEGHILHESYGKTMFRPK